MASFGPFQGSKKAGRTLRSQREKSHELHDDLAHLNALVEHIEAKSDLDVLLTDMEAGPMKVQVRLLLESLIDKRDAEREAAATAPRVTVAPADALTNPDAYAPAVPILE